MKIPHTVQTVISETNELASPKSLLLQISGLPSHDVSQRRKERYKRPDLQVLVFHSRKSPSKSLLSFLARQVTLAATALTEIVQSVIQNMTKMLPVLIVENRKLATLLPAQCDNKL
jgi:hypothetical protein